MPRSRKPRKPESRRPSQKKLQKMEEKRKAQERMQELMVKAQNYTRPFENNQTEIEACKQRVSEGKICYCKEVCSCRECQAGQKASAAILCTLQDLQREGGCAFGCNKCSECNPCY